MGAEREKERRWKTRSFLSIAAGTLESRFCRLADPAGMWRSREPVRQIIRGAPPTMVAIILSRLRGLHGWSYV